MIRKKIAVIMFLMLSLGLFAKESNYKLINDLKYNKVMHDAKSPQELFLIPFGSNESSVGGFEQDTQLLGEGVPFAFRPLADGSVWVLDSVNRALKLFTNKGKLQKSLDIKPFGKVVRDFAFDGNNGFWLLAPFEGFLYRIDNSGNSVGRIEGFFDANAIESANNNELLVDMPMMSSVLRFGEDELLKKEYAYDGGISMFEGVGGNLLGLEIEPKNIKLILRQQTVPPRNLTLTQFPLEFDQQDVTYAGARLIGKDAAGNLYLNLIACDSNGVIYRDRLYKCTIVGKVLAEMDVLSVPYIAPDLPRKRVVTPDGKIMTFYVKDDKYTLAVYTFEG